ncbi:Phosphoglycerate mutase [unidentified eubacterium SCB49]|nr:Phosphoglycerate mutase [unidentified eubacterium SCB49]
MRVSFAIVFISLFFFSCGNDKKSDLVKEKTTTYYLIRHAEKDRSDSTNKNPELNKIGQKRAIEWASYFKNIDFDLVYSTPYNRTQQTATPTAVSKNLAIKTYNPSAMYDENFKNTTKHKTVLVVGHSNTTPAFANAILGENKYEDIDDSENGMLYIVTVTDKGVTSTVQKIE